MSKTTETAILARDGSIALIGDAPLNLTHVTGRQSASCAGTWRG